ncbi:hypothetical protein C8R46DRAFT_1347919 [Mycena filopes]|nr:hypothetical protein C8R46DRAFT_1347919 [Mycena filopes]
MHPQSARMSIRSNVVPQRCTYNPAMYLGNSALILLILCTRLLALSPPEIIKSLDSLALQANQTTIALDHVLSKSGNQTQDIQISISMLNDLASTYVAFTELVVNTPGPITLDASISGQVLQAAQANSKTVAAMGITLAQCLPLYAKHGAYVAGCADGATIGFHAFTLFVHLGVQFPDELLPLLLTGVLQNVRVVLGDLAAVGCLVHSL